MDIFITLIIGVVIGAAGMFLVARNNKKRFLKAMDFTPKDLAETSRK